VGHHAAMEAQRGPEVSGTSGFTRVSRIPTVLIGRRQSVEADVSSGLSAALTE
jgi:hypothetical protein